ncbi:uncharacterized protein VNE69_08033 [Vairimorpha necatrix]|uniref:PH domain-containing protein n=1 Tax=Vairimorpha necatrix TaxID=6039 RepID=A0AAX4JE56_9MICR
MDDLTRKDFLSSPKSVSTNMNYKKNIINNNNDNMKISMKSNFADKYTKKDAEVYDFTYNKYIKSTNKIQDLINKYNKPVLKPSFRSMSPIDVLYSPRPVQNKGPSSSTRRESPLSFYNTNKIPVSGRINNVNNDRKTAEPRFYYDSYNQDKLRSSVSSTGAPSSAGSAYMKPTPYAKSTSNMSRPPSNISYCKPQSNMSYSKPQSNMSCPQSAMSCCKPQSVYSCGSQSDNNSVKSQQSYNEFNNNYTHNNYTHAMSDASSNINRYYDFPLYGPSVELTVPLSFTLLNSVSVFDKGSDSSVYYIQVSSNISWIIKKDIKTILKLLNTPEISSESLDKQVKDNMINTILNRLPMNKDIQYFIMTDITKDIKYKGEYLLINKIPYIFKIVGKALVSYNQNMRVNRLFILEQCQVESGRDEYSFFLRNKEEYVELSASCRAERDEWMRYLETYIRR